VISLGNHDLAFSPREKAPFSACQARSEAHPVFPNPEILNPIKHMPRRSAPGTTVFSVDIPHQAKTRFALVHDALGFKTKAETFEAIVYAVSTEGKIDAHALERIERKLDHLAEHLEDFA
jgi:hypothetical protein